MQGFLYFTLKPGKEKDIIMAIMNRYFERENTPNKFSIISAFTRDSLKGYIYVEARKQFDVSKDLVKISDLYLGKITLVPLEEMVELITIKKPKAQENLEIGGWVRMKRGKYAGDLAQIIDIFDSTESVLIKAVPRIDFLASKKQDFKNNDNKNDAKGDARPPQKLFNRKETEKVFGYNTVHKSGQYNIFKNENYDSFGYMQKEMGIIIKLFLFFIPFFHKFSPFRRVSFISF